VREIDACRGCGKPKSPETFGSYVAQHGPDAGQRKLVSRCRECVAKAKREWYQRPENRDRYKAKTLADYYQRKQLDPDLNFTRKLRHLYGMSVADYEAMLAAQGGVCAVCGSPPRTTGKARLDVDHCHRTGEVRGLLCGYCNRALSQVDDNTDLLHALINYLEGPSRLAG